MEVTKYTTVVGLEVHVQLNTLSKAFCGDPNTFGQTPNTNISAISLALPGTLPVLNQAHVAASLKLAHALQSEIPLESRFDRKNYFYPDLPKGYQITQDALPVCIGGHLTFTSGDSQKTVRIHHVHMEEDAGKSTHDQDDTYSVVDYNRAGTPLVEIVTEPDLRSAQEVHDFIAALQQLVRYLGISDGNMEEGSLRCDVNVSVMPEGSKVYGARNEIKNVNSKKFAKTAVQYEAQRQIDILNAGGSVTTNTLLFDAATGTTAPMRSKEEANDYRYFPDPDLPPVILDPSYITEIRESVTLLPWTAKAQLQTQYALSEYDAEILSREIEVVRTYHQVEVDQASRSDLASFFINKAIPYCHTHQCAISDLHLGNIAGLMKLIESGSVAKSAALSALSDPILSSTSPVDVQLLAEEHQLIQSADQDFLDDIIDKVLADNPDKVSAFQKGKKGLLGFFMGQVMARAQGKADPKILNTKLMRALNP